MNKDEFVYVTLIAASRESVWEALTTAEFTEQYWHSTRVESSWKVDDRIAFWVDAADGPIVGCEGKILVANRPSELSYTWRFVNNDQIGDEQYSRVTFTLESTGKYTKLTIVHDQFPEESNTKPAVEHGWPYVAAGLKTLVETRRAVDFSAYSQS